MGTMQTLSDPLRTVRAAVRDGRFQEAAAALAAVPEVLKEGAEWYLLSAMTAWRLGDYAGSRLAALEARARFRARGDTDGEMRADNVAAAGAFGLGDLAAAEDEWSRVRELARRLRDDLMVARCANNLGNISLYLARHDAAHGFYRLARAGFERLGFTHGVAETWINTAITWRDMRRFADAAAAADAALEAAAAVGAPRLVAEAHSRRGEAMAELGDMALARTQVERGLALARQERDRLAEHDALRILANIARMEGRPDEAVRVARQALAVALAVGHPWTIAEVQRDLGAAHQALGQRAEASHAFEAAAEAFEKLGATPRADRMRERAREATG
jgi:tetratricopeptide (TPR) repeat protein